jgi:hypothetical protein
MFRLHPFHFCDGPILVCHSLPPSPPILVSTPFLSTVLACGSFRKSGKPCSVVILSAAKDLLLPLAVLPCSAGFQRALCVPHHLRGRRSCLSFLELRACHAPPVVILSAAKDLLLPLAVRCSYRRHLAGSFDSRGDFPSLSRRRLACRAEGGRTKSETTTGTFVYQFRYWTNLRPRLFSAQGEKFQEADVAHHWHIHRKSRHDLVIVAISYTLGFAIFLALMIYVISAGN